MVRGNVGCIQDYTAARIQYLSQCGFGFFNAVAAQWRNVARFVHESEVGVTPRLT